MHFLREILFFYLKPRNSHFYTQRFGSFAAGNDAAVVIRKDNDGLAVMAVCSLYVIWQAGMRAVRFIRLLSMMR